jgi:hypothetical protein
MCNWIAMWYKPNQNQTAAAIADRYAEIALAAFANHIPAPVTTAATITRIQADLTALQHHLTPPRFVTPSGNFRDDARQGLSRLKGSI